MNVLIVDDDPGKLDDIAGVIVPLLPQQSNTQKVGNLSAARRLLTTTKFDLLVLDLKVPQTEHGEARLESGLDFIAELHVRAHYPVPPHCIVITAHDEGMLNLDTPGMEGVYACLKYSRDGDHWREQLTSRIKYLRTVLAADLANCAPYDFDLGVVCALEDIELRAILDLDWHWQAPTDPGDGDPSSYYFGTVQNAKGRTLRVVAAAAPQMGMAAMSVLCMKMIQQFRPRHICMPGIAAGVKKEKGVNFGDVLVAELSWDYGSGKLRVTDGKIELAPDSRPIYLDPGIRAQFVDLRNKAEWLAAIKANWRGETPDASIRIHIGPLASGAAVVADEAIVADVLRQQRKLVGIEMEVYGLYYAAANCAAPRPKAFAIKSICDYGDREKSDRYQAYAAYTSARVMDAYVRSKL